MSEQNTTYQLPALETETSNGTSTVGIATRLYTNRKIFLFGEINEETVYSFTIQMMGLAQDEAAPIDIYINSPGGEIQAGLVIYDLIRGCRAPVNLYCVGLAASMAALLLASGEKGRRFILPHSKVMIHEPLISGGMGGSATTIKETADAILRVREVVNGILAEHTGHTMEEIAKATDHDNFMTSQEAIDFGICDKICKNI